MLFIEPEKTMVILVGASVFPDDQESLPELPSVRNNIEDFSRLLKDSTILGVPEKNILILQDQSNASSVATRIALKAKEVADTLIFYYAGHGVIGRDSTQLHLAVRDTTDEAVDYNAIPIDQVKKAIYNSTANRKIMILDCCYSGRALDVMSGEQSLVRANIELKGTYAIASSPANKTSSAPKNEKHTAFTGELLKVLEQGLDNGKEGITLNELYESVRNELRRRPNAPEPQRVNFQDADKLVFCRNRKMLLSGIESKVLELQNMLKSRLDEQETRINEQMSSFRQEQNARFEELSNVIQLAKDSGGSAGAPNSADENTSSFAFITKKVIPRLSVAALSGLVMYMFPFIKGGDVRDIGIGIATVLIVTHLFILAFNANKEGWSRRMLDTFFTKLPRDGIYRYTSLSLLLIIAALLYQYIQYYQLRR